MEQIENNNPLKAYHCPFGVMWDLKGQNFYLPLLRVDRKVP